MQKVLFGRVWFPDSFFLFPLSSAWTGYLKQRCYFFSRQLEPNVRFPALQLTMCNRFLPSLMCNLLNASMHMLLSTHPALLSWQTQILSDSVCESNWCGNRCSHKQRLVRSVDPSLIPVLSSPMDAHLGVTSLPFFFLSQLQLFSLTILHRYTKTPMAESRDGTPPWLPLHFK